MDNNKAVNSFSGKPTPLDICFDNKNHPGTKKCNEVIKRYILSNPGVSYGPAAYDEIRSQQIPSTSNFLIRDNESTCWRLASNHEIISYLGEVWKQQRKQIRR